MATRDEILDALIAEALGEGEDGMAAVAWSMVNRATERGADIGDIVTKGAYSGLGNPGRSVKQAQRDPAVRAKASNILNAVQTGAYPDPTGGATHYWAPKGMPGGKDPYWADEEASRVGQFKIGNHVYLPKRTPSPIPPGEIPNTVGTALSTSRTPPAVPPRRPDTLVSGLRTPTSAGDGLALNPVNVGRQAPPMFDGEYSALNQGMMRMPAPAASWGMNQQRTPFPAMPSPQMAGLRATRPDTQIAANQAAEQMRSRSNIGQPPVTRSAQSIPMPAIPSLSPSPPRGGSSVMDDYAYNTQPFMPRVNANAPDRLVAEAGIPELFGNGRIGGIGGNAVAPIPFNRPGLAMLPPLANPMQLPTADQLAAATGFRAAPMQMPGMPQMPFARPNRQMAPMPMPANMRPQQMARAPNRAPMPMLSRPVARAPQNIQAQRPPLQILVQGSNTSQSPQQAERRAWGTPNERRYNPDTAQWD